MNPNIIELQNEPSIKMSTNVHLAAGLKPRRVVLRELPGKFVTHMEYLRIDVRTEEREGRKYDVIVCAHESFDQGHYFDYEVNGVNKKDAFKEAMEDFEARSDRL